MLHLFFLKILQFVFCYYWSPETASWPTLALALNICSFGKLFPSLVFVTIHFFPLSYCQSFYFLITFVGTSSLNHFSISDHQSLALTSLFLQNQSSQWCGFHYHMYKTLTQPNLGQDFLWIQITYSLSQWPIDRNGMQQEWTDKMDWWISGNGKPVKYLKIIPAPNAKMNLLSFPINNLVIHILIR